MILVLLQFGVSFLEGSLYSDTVKTTGFVWVNRSQLWMIDSIENEIRKTTDTVEHTICACGRWHSERRALAPDIGHFDPHSLVESLLHVVHT